MIPSKSETAESPIVEKEPENPGDEYLNEELDDDDGTSKAVLTSIFFDIPDPSSLVFFV